MLLHQNQETLKQFFESLCLGLMGSGDEPGEGFWSHRMTHPWKQLGSATLLWIDKLLLAGLLRCLCSL